MLLKVCKDSIVSTIFPFTHYLGVLFHELFDTGGAIMSLLSIAPDIVAGASEKLADLGSALRSANAAAATQTTSIAAPAADEVSAAITALFGTHAQGFQAASAKAAALHDDFVNL